MKSKTILAASFLLTALFCGCMSADKLNSIRIGMPKSEVIAIMGQPDSMSAQADVEYLTYYLAPNNSQIRDQPYMIRIVDGKVESYGRFAQLFDLYNRPVTSARPGDANFPSGTGLPMGTVMAPAMTPAMAVAPAVTNDIAGEIQKLKALKDQGVLTEEEFRKAKEKVLSEQK